MCNMGGCSALRRRHGLYEGIEELSRVSSGITADKPTRLERRQGQNACLPWPVP
jgi:hypothetical protein